MRKDVRQFIRRLEALGLTVESTPATTTFCATVSHSGGQRNALHAAVLARHTRWRRAAIVELRKLGIDI
jgi:hypothetical protein